MPELPPEFLARRSVADDVPPPSYTPVQVKLQQAFRPGCAEMEYSFKIEMRAKDMVLAANEVRLDPEGRLVLSPFSLATFKEHPGNSPKSIPSTPTPPISNSTGRSNRCTKSTAGELSAVNWRAIPMS